MACTLVACTKPEADSATRKDSGGNVLRFDVWGPIGSLDPNAGEAGSGNTISSFIYSYLFIENEQGQLEPDLATCWDYDTDTFTWTLMLREGALFHNGKPVTSCDVKYSLETYLRNNVTSECALIKRIIPVRDHMVTIVLNRDDPDFLKKIWPIDIVPQPDGDNVAHASHPIGSGPFKFDYKRGEEEVGLVANDNYYCGRPSLDGVVFYFQPDKEKSWARLLSGKTDLVLGLNPMDYEMIKQYQDRFHFNTTVDPYRTLILYNTHDALFADPKVRMAIAYAIDKEYIRNVILKKMGIIPVGAMGYYSPFRNPKLQPIPYDPGKSLKLLQEMGWNYDQDGRFLQKDGKYFEFTLLFFRESEFQETVGRYIQLCLADIGIKVRLQGVAFNELLQKYWCNRSFQAVITEFEDIRHNFNSLLQLWYPLGENEVGAGAFKEPKITQLIGDALQERDPLRKKMLLYEVDSLLTSLQPATYLSQRASLNVLSKKFKLPRSFSPIYARFHFWKISPVLK